MNIAIDLDNTLVSWEGDGKKCGKWLEGAKRHVQQILDDGRAVVVHSCRVNWKESDGVEGILAFLRAEGFEVTPVTDTWNMPGGTLGVWSGVGKPVAYVYVDDRALHFNGNWKRTYAQINERLARR